MHTAVDDMACRMYIYTFDLHTYIYIYIYIKFVVISIQRWPFAVV